MKNLFILSILVLVSFSVVAQSEFTTISLHSTDASIVSVDNDDAVITIEPTKGSRVIIETTVKLSINNDALAEFIKNQGRHNVSFDETVNGNLTIKYIKPSTINSTTTRNIEEKVYITIKLPDTVKVVE